jgi:hypothetical protein
MQQISCLVRSLPLLPAVSSPSMPCCGLQFFCMGHSVYEGYATRSDGDTSGSEASSSSSSSGGQPSTLPYCEGLEVRQGWRVGLLLYQKVAAAHL